MKIIPGYGIYNDNQRNQSCDGALSCGKASTCSKARPHNHSETCKCITCHWRKDSYGWTDSKENK